MSVTDFLFILCIIDQKRPSLAMSSKISAFPVDPLLIYCDVYESLLSQRERECVEREREVVLLIYVSLVV